MVLRRLLAIAVLQLASGWVHACLFATSTPPAGWFEWSTALFAGDVTALEKDAQKPVDVVIVKVVETFKVWTPCAALSTVRLSGRYWSNCKVEMPAVGARVLVATNANSDAMLVPLSASYAEQLRAHRIRGQGHK